MELWVLICHFLWILPVTYGSPANIDGFKGVGKPYTLTPKTKWRGPGRGKINHPDVLEYSLKIEGRESIDIHLERDMRMAVPRDAMLAHRKLFDQLDIGGPAFYRDTGGHGSYSCQLKKDRSGNYECEIHGLVTFDSETCIIVPDSNMADCRILTDGMVEYFEDPEDEQPRKKSKHLAKVQRKLKRRRRAGSGTGFGMPDPGQKVVEVAFVLDAEFMKSFYERFPDDIFRAQQEAEMLITLHVTEMNVFFWSLSDASEGELTLSVFPSTIHYPTYGDDFRWSSDFNQDGYLYRSVRMIRELELFARSGFTANKFDHVMFISGFDYHNGKDRGQNYLGFAYMRTVCTDKPKQFSMFEYDHSQTGFIATHELGHALGAVHDGSTECDNSKYVMSQYMNLASSFVKSSKWEFSRCSADAIKTHLNSHPDCTANNGFTDEQFKNAFCSGLLGQAQFSTDLQCKKLTGWSESTACELRVDRKYICTYGYLVSCKTSQGRCSKWIQQLWNGTPCGNDKMCFKGKCEDKFHICPVQEN